MCLGTGEFLQPQGAIPPGLYTLRGGWVYCLAPEAPQKGECRRGRRYFWPCRTRVGFDPATGPTLKTALCHIRALVGRFDKYRGLHGRSRAFVCGLSSPVLGLHSVGRLTSGRFCRVCLGTGDFLRPQGAIPPGLYPLRGGLLPGAWGAPKREMPKRTKVFLALLDECGLRPCDRTHLKNGLVPYSCVGGTLR